MPIGLRPAIAAALTLAVMLAGCEKLKPNQSAEDARTAARERALARKLQAACSSPATYDRLKQVAFEEAVRIRNSDPANLDTLAAHSIVRMENPVVKSRDNSLDVTVCSGRFVLDLPLGAERGFGGARRLSADVEYAAQMAADGSGLVYQIKGAEPIIYKLAAFDLRNQTYPAPGSRRGASAANSRVSDVDLATRQQVLPQPVPPPPQARAEPIPPPPPREASANPAFNCRNARMRSERMVCGSPQLASLDRAMSSLFYSVMSDADGGTRAELRRSRDRFLAWRDRCPDERCVAQGYMDRMAEIRDIGAGR